MDDTLHYENGILRDICNLVCDALNVIYEIHGIWGYPNCYVTFIFANKYVKWSCNIYITKQIVQYYDFLKHLPNDQKCPNNVREPLNGSIWEPACGEGHMGKVLKDYYPDSKISLSDLVERQDIFNLGIRGG